MNLDTLKDQAAREAVKLVQQDMTLGLGTGSTAKYFIDALGERVRDGLSVTGIPTSEQTREFALAAGIELVEPDETTQIHLAIDGADEIDPRLSLVKGGGGALLREKIIAEAADKFVVIADSSKKVAQLGAFPLPVEIEQFCWPVTVRRLRETLSTLGYASASLDLRSAGVAKPFVSDGGNLIVDCQLDRIGNASDLDKALRDLPGVVETGLFVSMADTAIIASQTGIETITS